ncbi:hypothetical protein [Nocardioides sp. HB32]
MWSVIGQPAYSSPTTGPWASTTGRAQASVDVSDTRASATPSDWRTIRAYRSSGGSDCTSAR